MVKLRQDPLCEDCLLEGLHTPAKDVDHVIPVRQRPDLRLVLSNLRSLCKPHHSRKTAKENGGFGNG